MWIEEEKLNRIQIWEKDFLELLLKSISYSWYSHTSTEFRVLRKLLYWIPVLKREFDSLVETISLLRVAKIAKTLYKESKGNALDEDLDAFFTDDNILSTLRWYYFRIISRFTNWVSDDIADILCSRETETFSNEFISIHSSRLPNNPKKPWEAGNVNFSNRLEIKSTWESFPTNIDYFYQTWLLFVWEKQKYVIYNSKWEKISPEWEYYIDFYARYLNWKWVLFLLTKKWSIIMDGEWNTITPAGEYYKFDFKYLLKGWIIVASLNWRGSFIFDSNWKQISEEWESWEDLIFTWFNSLWIIVWKLWANNFVVLNKDWKRITPDWFTLKKIKISPKTREWLEISLQFQSWRIADIETTWVDVSTKDFWNRFNN